MKFLSWNTEKNELLKKERQISFEEVVFYIEMGFLPDVLEHPNQEQKEKYRAYAKATFRKDKRVNIRISEKDLLALQTRAIRQGIPYQTLISSVLHKYVNGTLTEK